MNALLATIIAFMIFGWVCLKLLTFFGSRAGHLWRNERKTPFFRRRGWEKRT